MAIIKIIFVILFAILIAVFAVKNMDLVEVSFYDFHLNSHNIQIPLLIVVLCSLGLGFLIAWISGTFAQLKLRSVIRRQDKTINFLNSELQKLNRPSLPEKTISND